MDSLDPLEGSLWRVKVEALDPGDESEGSLARDVLPAFGGEARESLDLGAE